MIDYKALKGDPTDNIPGVPGVGEKTAAKLIREFGDLESLFARIDEVTPEKLREKLREHREQIAMGHELSKIVCDLPIAFDLESARLSDYDRDTVVRLFREYEFRTLIERLPPMAGESAQQRSDSLRSVVESGYVPAARVAGRPEGWGAGRAGGRPTGGELQLRLDFDSVAGAPGEDHAAPDGGPARTYEPAEDLPTALAAAIVDPGRIEVRGPDRIEDLATSATATWEPARTRRRRTRRPGRGRGRPRSGGRTAASPGADCDAARRPRGQGAPRRGLRR
jgi:hypothetical protein